MKIIKIVLSLLLAVSLPSCGEEEVYNVVGSNGDGSDWDVEFNGAVDLGLSVEWAACDLGANLPYTSGTSYKAAEIFGVYKSNHPQIKSICGTEADPATTDLGSEWRMPTRQELEELIADCNWTRGEFHKTDGWFVRGPSGKTIFLTHIDHWSGDIYEWQWTSIGCYQACGCILFFRDWRMPCVFLLNTPNDDRYLIRPVKIKNAK